MPWFHNEESGQIFEAEEGSDWEKEARARGCKEVKAPKGAKSYAEESKQPEPATEPQTVEPDGGQPEGEDEGNASSSEPVSETEPKDLKADAKGGKEKK